MCHCTPGKRTPCCGPTCCGLSEGCAFCRPKGRVTVEQGPPVIRPKVKSRPIRREELHLTCAGCGGDLEVIEGRLPAVPPEIRAKLGTPKCNASEADPDHFHARCPRCSPEWWHACIKIRVEIQPPAL